MATAPDVTVRTDLRPGDLGAVVSLHGVVYAREYGFDETFEAYVAGPLADYVKRRAPRERLWLAERGGRLVGSVAIVEASAEVGQLRWYLVGPEARGAGLGTRLLNDAIGFARFAGYGRLVLWTVSALTGAARRYQAAGLVKLEERARRAWGVDVVEERYELELAGATGA